MARVNSPGSIIDVPAHPAGDSPQGQDLAPAPRSIFSRWAYVAVRRRRAVLGAWVAFLVVLGVLSATVGGDLADSFTIPGTESQAALDLLEERFPSQAGDTAQIVVRADAGVADPAVQPRVEALLAEAATLPGVIAVDSPYTNSANVSADGTIAYATVQYEKLAFETPLDDIKQLTALVDRSGGSGLTVEAGGSMVAQAEQEPPSESSAIAIGAAMVVLLIAFGSVVAMGLPIATALAGLVAGFLGIGLAARFVDIASFTPAIAAMIGLGVGIDYALFIVSRYREGLGEGRSVADAVAVAMETAGRAVAFAGLVVVVALMGLFAIGLPFVTAFAIASSLMVGFSILVALTLLPALLGFAGTRVDRFRIPGIRPATNSKSSLGYRISGLIGRSPIAYALASAAILLLLAAPLLNVKLGFPDSGSSPETYHTRRAYDLLSTGFGPGFNGPLLIAIESDGAVDLDGVENLRAALSQTPGVVEVAPAVVSPAGDTAVVSFVPTTSPQDDHTSNLVNRIRADVVPAALEGTSLEAYVGGATASYIDVNDRMSSRTPYFIAIVLGLSVLLLTAVFRSPVIAIKAAVMNLLSIGSAFGVVIAVFQWGWGASLFGVNETGPIASFMPMFLFAILFGLSMDYEVFLLSRIREAYLRTGETRQAVADGLGVTARVITAAAAVMVLVFLSFLFTDDAITKQFGLGLATAILVDATIVRMILVPATMELLGKWNWWFPTWLDRLVPHISVEGHIPSMPSIPNLIPPVAPQPGDLD